MEVLAALRALPEIAAALKELGTGIKEANAARRKEEKQTLVDDLIASARERRLRKQEVKRVSGDSGEESGGDGGGDSNA